MRRCASWLLLLLIASGCARAAGQPEAVQIRVRTDAIQREPLAAVTLGSASLAADVARFYALRSDRSLWQSPTRLRQLATALDGLADDGLTPKDYGVVQLERDADWLATDPSRAAVRRTDVDVHATAIYLLALYQLAHGVVDPHKLNPSWHAATPVALSDAALHEAAEKVEQGRVAEAFDQARPQQPIYSALRAAMRRLRGIVAAGGWPTVPPGPSLKPGAIDPRIPALRQRLAIAGDLVTTDASAPDSDRFDAALESAVRRYQEQHLLDSDGVAGPATLASLNVPASVRVGQLRANLERARWFLRGLPSRFVLIDIAGYRLTYFDGSKPAWRARVQVGQPKRPTPELRSEITSITLNPQWVVPPTILRKDILPKVRRDPSYLSRNRLSVFDASGHKIDARSIDWQHPPAGLTLKQDAGPQGALGVVAIRFPNPYDVYLHNTPHTELFVREQRAFSSGCVRVEHPLELAQLLLDDPAQWDRAALDAAVATGETRNVPLTHPVPVLLLYWTAHVLDNGNVVFKPDIYHQDHDLLMDLEREQERLGQAIREAD